MNLLKALAIFYVVVGHLNPYLFSIIRQPYSFHMPLFYFISGYFYDQNYENNKYGYIWSKFKKNICIFYFYFLLLIIISLFIAHKYSISLGTISLRIFLINPFTWGLGNPGFFMNPSWFVVSLFLVQSIFVLIFPIIKKYLKNDLYKLLFFIFIGLFSIYLNNVNNNLGQFKNELILTITRTIIGIMFYYFGYFYNINIENKINIFNGKVLILSMILISFITSFNLNINFLMVNGSYYGHVFLPIIVSIIGIYISVFIAKSLSKVIKNKNDILHIIGKNSYYIMIFHLFIFFVISLFYFKINNISDVYYSNLAEFPFFPNIINKNKFWPIYISLGILLPTFYGEFYKKIKKYFLDKMGLFFKKS